MDPPDSTPDLRPGTTTSPSLLLRLRRSEPEAWERLVALYSPLVYAWCHRAGLQDADAADVFQEVFRAVAAHLASFRKERPSDSFRAWVHVIARRKIADFYRSRGRRVEGAGGTTAQALLVQIEAPAPGSEVEDVAPAGEEETDARQLLRHALEMIRGQVEERTWQAFWWTVVEERPTSDVARELSMSPGAVRVARFRVLERLRDEVGDLL